MKYLTILFCWIWITQTCVSLDFDDAMYKVDQYFHSKGHNKIGFIGRNEYNEISLQATTRKKVLLNIANLLT